MSIPILLTSGQREGREPLQSGWPASACPPGCRSAADLCSSTEYLQPVKRSCYYHKKNIYTYLILIHEKSGEFVANDFGNFGIDLLRVNSRL